jgi:signal transduction histidine kinase
MHAGIPGARMMQKTGSSKAGRLPDPGEPRGGQAEKILATHGRVLQLIATGKPFEKVLEALVDAVEAHCEGAIGSVLLMDNDGEHLRHGAAPRLPDAYNRAVDGLRIGPCAASCGTAAYRGEPVIVEDVATDPLWADFRHLAEDYRFGACWSHPIFSMERKVLGTLAMYYREPRGPSEADREFIAAVAHLAGIAVERQRAEQKRRASERRLLKQKTVLVELAKSEPLAGSDFRAFCQLATEAAAETLDVERVSVWLFNEERSILRCESLYELSIDRHSSGIELESSKYPRYFAALERGRSVVAHDANRDADTSEFSESYLTPLGITSMLDAPIRRAGRLVGVVCHEHIGPRRIWAADEQDFAASVGDFVSLALEAGERRRAEQAFRSAQEELLRQDFQARRQIEFELDSMKGELVRQTRLATVGQVAARIAHELRKPCQAIAASAAALRDRVPPGEAAWVGQLDIIEKEIRRSDVTMQNLLAMSRAKDPVKQVVDLGGVVQKTFGCVESSDGIELRLVADPDPFLVEADPDQLRQVLVNLISNAVEAVQDRGRITVEARRRDGFDEIVVTDSGSGIPSDLWEQIFEPLVTTKVEGTGLGLAICRQIVERHGGAIEVVATVEPGATFRIRLPRTSSA